MRKLISIIAIILVAIVITINSIKITNITNNLVTYKVLGIEFNYYVEN